MEILRKLILVTIVSFIVIDSYSQHLLGSGRPGVDVNIQDQSTDIVDLYLCRFLNEVTLSAPTIIDSNKIILESGHGFVVGNTVCLKYQTYFFQAEIISVDTDTVRTDSPLDYNFPVVSESFRSTNEMAADGSSTPLVYRVTPPNGTKWDIVRILFVITDDASMDDGKFGGITALTKGIVIRKKDGVYKNIFNVKRNGDFRLRAYDLSYVDATLGPGGLESLGVRRTFGGQSKNGVVIRLDGELNEEFQCIIQDNLTGLSSMHAVVQGHVVED